MSNITQIQDNPFSISRKLASFGRCAQVWPIGRSRMNIGNNWSKLPRPVMLNRHRSLSAARPVPECSNVVPPPVVNCYWNN